MVTNQWVQEFTLTDDDISEIVNLMLETEQPRTTRELALWVVGKHLETEQARLEERYKDALVYNPSATYEEGQRLIFTDMEYATGIVVESRAGANSDYGDFQVVSVEFDDNGLNLANTYREFASGLQTEHRLSTVDQDNPFAETSSRSPEEVLEEAGNQFLRTVHEALVDNDVLERVAGYWFPRDLIMEFDIGTLHLSEAVLDMNGGGALSTQEIIEQIGGLGDVPMSLQVFSLNIALKGDKRFDEVGPAGHVRWYLHRMEPGIVQKKPPLLQYSAIDYDEEDMSDDLFDLETEIDDEITEIDFEGRLKKATTTLIYPHRRLGTLPLNAKNRAIFPSARSERIYVELVDQIDESVYDGWVVHNHQYVYGLEEFYTKHKLPVGTYITVERGAKAGQIIIGFDNYKPRTEWINVLNPINNQIHFENTKRIIGAEYDDLVIIGVDDIAAVDDLSKTYANRGLASILREIINELSKFSPQGTVHAITLYSAVNVVRRCPPGPIFATLSSSPDFQDVGDYYWKLSNA